MLFLVKRQFWPALLLAAALTAFAVWAWRALSLTWSFSCGPIDLVRAAVAGLALATSDGALHGLLFWIGGERYLSRYRAFLNVFCQQRAPQILMGGLLAAAEEMVFRGVLLEWLLNSADWPAAAAWTTTAGAFAAMHAMPDRKLAPFMAWVFWEGLLLNGVYVWSGSLAVSALVHAAHDIAGFSLFAWQRGAGTKAGAGAEKAMP